ncbi:Iron-sulfur cluster co-chaperone protein HscB, mitochondrial [Oopsacas minuta]|uniref:Iron-sulfur cluster co-chaperone protein HscB, mitochondrial n=1 Tax=Oopsacas minuta TaxID=111878 RepID=A0AAV7JLW4_9METZ|nr:Iron-sulfur cluster co-chaperone protein HscB, mitochondrial [Oopsacas minuta]
MKLSALCQRQCKDTAKFRFFSNSEHKNIKKSTKVTCWKCQKCIVLNPSHTYSRRYFCPCERRIILPYTKHTNYFEIYDSLPTFKIDVSKLKSTYLKLQYQFHPDRFSTSSQREQDMAAEHSAVVSTSYKTISNTYSRALYLLLLEGIDLEKTGNTSEIAPEFLMEMFETNEQLEDGLNDRDLIELKLKTHKQISKCYSDLIPAFCNRNFAKAKSIVAQLQYYRNILNKIGDILDANTNL